LASKLLRQLGQAVNIGAPFLGQFLGGPLGGAAGSIVGGGVGYLTAGSKKAKRRSLKTTLLAGGAAQVTGALLGRISGTGAGASGRESLSAIIDDINAGRGKRLLQATVEALPQNLPGSDVPWGTGPEEGNVPEISPSGNQDQLRLPGTGIELPTMSGPGQEEAPGSDGASSAQGFMLPIVAVGLLLFAR